MLDETLIVTYIKVSFFLIKKKSDIFLLVSCPLWVLLCGVNEIIVLDETVMHFPIIRKQGISGPL